MFSHWRFVLLLICSVYTLYLYCNGRLTGTGSDAKKCPSSSGPAGTASYAGVVKGHFSQSMSGVPF